MCIVTAAPIQLSRDSQTKTGSGLCHLIDGKAPESASDDPAATTANNQHEPISVGISQAVRSEATPRSEDGTTDTREYTFCLTDDAVLSPDKKPLSAEQAELFSRLITSLNSTNAGASPEQTETEGSLAVLSDEEKATFERLLQLSANRCFSDTLELEQKAFNDCLRRGYTAKQIQDGYERYQARYKAEHPNTTKYVQRIYNWLSERGDGIAFDAGYPKNRTEVRKPDPQEAEAERIEHENRIKRADSEYVRLFRAAMDKSKETMRQRAADASEEEIKRLATEQETAWKVLNEYTDEHFKDLEERSRTLDL